MDMYFLTSRKEHTASVLVLVLWIVVLLTVMTAVLARTSRLDTRITGISSDRFRCKWASRGGLETAIAVLNDDDASSDSLGDAWSDSEIDFNGISFDGCSVDVEVVDESGKLNINKITKAQLMYLPDMTEEIANSIVDWRDRDDKIRDGSAEEGYYNNLPHPYAIRNGLFKTIRELLLVKGITPQLLYGPSKYPQSAGIEYSEENEGWITYLTCYSLERNVDADGIARVNINTANESKLINDVGLSSANAKWIVDNRGDGFNAIADLIPENNKKSGGSRGSAPLKLQTVLDIADKITVVNGREIIGKVNLNTAPLDVLTVLLDGRDDIAEGIIGYRSDQFFGITSLGELSEISSLSTKHLKKLIDVSTVRSDIFTVYSYAEAERTSFQSGLEAVVDRGTSPVQIIYMRTGAIN
jgi:type II secretory pathway component PulK